jgi:hypothetical protein
VPRRNRIDPWGDLHAAAARGLFTGNRGCLVDTRGETVRHHRGRLWITCVTQFGDRRFPLAQPGRWTPIFFLDDAVALAAGHRPCAFCRRADYRSYRDAVGRVDGGALPLRATDLDRRLAAERHRPGRGLTRAGDRRLWRAPVDDLPPGTVVIDAERRSWLLLADRLLLFGFDGWSAPIDRPTGAEAEVLTPPTSAAALGHGYSPVLHPSALAPD